MRGEIIEDFLVKCASYNKTKKNHTADDVMVEVNKIMYLAKRVDSEYDLPDEVHDVLDYIMCICGGCAFKYDG